MLPSSPYAKKSTFLHWIVICGFLLFLSGCHQNPSNVENVFHTDSTYQDTMLCSQLYGICIDTLDTYPGTVKSGESLSVILSRFGVPASTIHYLSQNSKEVFDVRQIRRGQPYMAMLKRDTTAALQYWVYEKDRTHFVVYDFTTDSIRVTEQQKDVTARLRRIATPINGSLWMTIYDQHINTALSDILSDIYAWQVDFFGIAQGDSISALFDEIYLDTLSIGIGTVHGAFFHHNGKDYYAIPFIQQDSIRSFFDEQGMSLRKAFLKAPLKYSRISSSFSNSRYHPVLKVYRAHHGIDYAAPTGTPVYSIGDGTITKRAYQKNGGGNYVTVKHNATYSSTYMHLSRFAKGIAVGIRVSQGQVIGYVGATGLATGPHLDFRVYKNGTAINPLTMESPSVEPIKEENKAQFEAVRDSIITLLEQPF